MLQGSGFRVNPVWGFEFEVSMYRSFQERGECLATRVQGSRVYSFFLGGGGRGIYVQVLPGVLGFFSGRVHGSGIWGCARVWGLGFRK